MDAAGAELGEKGFLIAGLVLILACLVFDGIRNRLHAKRLAARGPDYRNQYYRELHWTMWSLTGALVLFWLGSGRSLATLGFSHEAGWGLAAAWVLALAIGLHLAHSLVEVRRSPEALASVRDQFEAGGDLGLLTPETPRQARDFYAVSMTAGITEEIICRGFLIGALAVFMPVWLAAPLSVLIFVGAHAYQGMKGMVRILPISVVLTLMFVVSGSLWPGMVLHVLVDMVGGAMMWRVARDPSSGGRPSEAP